MSSGPDLFVVCKSCGSEVSPYITECPYCGTRLRKRAPKLERGGVPKAEKAKRTRPRLGRLRPGEIPGIRGDRRPYITITLVLAAVIVTLRARAGLWDVSRLILGGPLGDEYWRTVTTSRMVLQGRASPRMPGISPGRSGARRGRGRLRRAERGAFGTPPFSSLGARLRSRVPQYGHSVMYGETSARQFLQTTKRSGPLDMG